MDGSGGGVKPRLILVERKLLFAISKSNSVARLRLRQNIASRISPVIGVPVVDAAAKIIISSGEREREENHESGGKKNPRADLTQTISNQQQQWRNANNQEAWLKHRPAQGNHEKQHRRQNQPKQQKPMFPKLRRFRLRFAAKDGRSNRRQNQSQIGRQGHRTAVAREVKTELIQILR